MSVSNLIEYGGQSQELSFNPGSNGGVSDVNFMVHCTIEFRSGAAHTQSPYIMSQLYTVSVFARQSIKIMGLL